MIRTVIKPTKSHHSFTLEIPQDYLGEELEVLVFKKNENLKDGENLKIEHLSDKYRGVFTKKDAIEFDKNTKKMRSEW